MSVIYPQLDLPESWKPLFRALDGAGWELHDAHAPSENFCDRPVLVYENRQMPEFGARYLAFLEEPIWCGNTAQPRGFTIAAFSTARPENRDTAEQHCLPLTQQWQAELPDFVEGLNDLSHIAPSTTS
ncbi:MAG: hypothetical protein AAF570_25675 [Bacteroidota bacterium]